ncbi:Lipin/Ned1/Smp2-domain-containing protein [Polychytrium aggregatum]|uniref:Lipin/Ned1/Smp2-domain-containing protein n=1 Tax=Polychytrium aggregatum TaxID=110093 RepID=UPI0022FDBEEE|nr:Lipin/Ned1/Smp2-domain-containing protein [Polychytrium aggregatum]KAI9205268.1 Lipin/Ned1/Smp2-domain-containing protein [Polychytrium aggregatum]
MSSTLSFVGKVVSSVADFYKDINPATLSGAIDVVVVESEQGELSCSPFHVRFGKLKLLRPHEKVVELAVNGQPTGLEMKVGEAGEAFFVIGTETDTVEVFDLGDAAPGPSDLQDAGRGNGYVSAHGSDIAPDEYPSDQVVLTVSEEAVVVSTTHDLEEGQAAPAQPESTSQIPPQLVDGGPDSADLRVPAADDLPEEGDADLLLPRPIRARALSNDYSDSRAAMSRFAVKSLPEGPQSDNEVEYQDSQSTSTRDRSGWSWRWGGLPVKSSDDKWAANPVDPVTPDQSVPLSTQEKVDSYLATLSSAPPPPLNEGAVSIPIPSDTEAPLPESSAAFSVELSLCGSKDFATLVGAAADELFEKHKVVFDQFSQSPAILSDPSLIIRLGKTQYHQWQTAAPIIISQVAFGKSISDATVKKTAEKTSESNEPSGYWGLKAWWSRSGAKPEAEHKEGGPAPQTGPTLEAPAPMMSRSVSLPGEVTRTSIEPPSPALIPETPTRKPWTNYAKSLRLNSDQLKALNLNKGVNTVTFTVTTSLQGKAECTSKIFFWDYNTKVVISDVDGTITKSDALGHIFTMVGKDWTHSGVANLYTNIKKNGYEILYLTSRAIGQAGSTRDYLKKVEQGTYQLPEGPIIMSPDRLFRSFHREVILRRPEEFKIACLRDIQRLWGPNAKPFYAGFGNRITDALSYRSVDIPPSRIFTIDPAGDVKLELMNNYKSTYVKLNDIVDHIFPSPDSAEAVDFSDLSFWKSVIPEIDLEAEKQAGVVAQTPATTADAAAAAAVASGTAADAGAQLGEQPPPPLDQRDQGDDKDVEADDEGGVEDFEDDSDEESRLELENLKATPYL